MDKNFRELYIHHSPQRQLNLCNYAAIKLKECGFILQYTSAKSEACYYNYPEKRVTLRVAAHRYSRNNHSDYTLGKVVSCLTFSEDFFPKTMASLDGRIAQAIGFYFLNQDK